MRQRPDGLISRRPFVPAPPFPAAYGFSAAIALGLGLFGGFAVGLYALGVLAFGWPATYYAPLVQAHGQVQILGLAGLLILGVGGLLLPGFWRARLDRAQSISLRQWAGGRRADRSGDRAAARDGARRDRCCWLSRPCCRWWASSGLARSWSRRACGNPAGRPPGRFCSPWRGARSWGRCCCGACICSICSRQASRPATAWCIRRSSRWSCTASSSPQRSRSSCGYCRRWPGPVLSRDGWNASASWRWCSP